MREVRAVYAEVDARPVERACTRLTECCKFKLTGSTPMLTKGEAMVAIHAMRASGRKRLPESLDPKAGACPMLGPKGKCIIYADRPFGCRTHFCEAAGGPYARKDVVDLIHRLEKVDQALAGYGAREINSALRLVMEEMD